VVDDHPIVREGIRMCLKDRAEVRIVGEAADGVEAIERVTEVEADVVLLDLTMPRMGGFEALPKIRRARPEARVIVVTVHNARDYLRQAMALRADGYVLKDTSPEEYVEAILAVWEGGVFISPALRGAEHSTVGAAARRFSLTPREVEFLSLAAKGKRTPEIAHEMNCTMTAVRSYQRRTMWKLGVTNIAMLTQAALQHGL